MAQGIHCKTHVISLIVLVQRCRSNMKKYQVRLSNISRIQPQQDMNISLDVKHVCDQKDPLAPPQASPYFIAWSFSTSSNNANRPSMSHCISLLRPLEEKVPTGGLFQASYGGGGSISAFAAALCCCSYCSLCRFAAFLPCLSRCSLSCLLAKSGFKPLLAARSDGQG